MRCAERVLLWAALAVVIVPASRSSRADDVEFSRDVLPILQARCLKCHGGVKREGGLTLLRREDLLVAADSGLAAVVPGRPEASELLRRVAADDADRMPADGKPLPESEIETLRAWIAQGARWPTHWSLRPVRRPALPPVGNAAWVRNPIDQFVLVRLEAAGIEPSAEADRATLIRRLSLDLLGLPPSPEEIRMFEADRSADAYERLVDRLLASPHFGERWGRHWLDLARYADTDGYEVDGVRPNAWYYRDWVIRAVNDDRPFDRFTVEQLAGDLLPNATWDQHLATAFHRQTLTNKEAGADQEEYRVEAVIDRVNTTATVWLGLTAGCAQCHDHPYDPLRQREFYGLFAFFNNADESRLRRPTADEEEYQRRRAAHEESLRDLRMQLDAAPEAEREALQARLEELKKQAPPDPAVLLDVMAERAQPRTTYVFRRGNFLSPDTNDVVSPGTPSVLLPMTPRSADEPADRLDLARWLVDPANPLTPRVAVNHVWQHLFGVGLVRTPDDFGRAGEPPTHPELLDWLADDLVRSGWGRKRLIRLIVTSATYRQSAAHRPELAEVDPENRLLHRQNRVRVEAEIVRDLHLAAAGLLSRKIGGPSVFPPFPQDFAKIDFRSDLKWETSRGLDRYRRGMYTFFKRTLPDPNLTTFDCPQADSANVWRNVSNTPLQALATLNNEVFVEAAQALALRILESDVHDDEARLALAYRICLSRSPTDGELSRLTTLLADHREWYAEHPDDARRLVRPSDHPDLTEAAAWTATASIILNLDEFITRE